MKAFSDTRFTIKNIIHFIICKLVLHIYHISKIYSKLIHTHIFILKVILFLSIALYKSNNNNKMSKMPSQMVKTSQFIIQDFLPSLPFQALTISSRRTSVPVLIVLATIQQSSLTGSHLQPFLPPLSQTESICLPPYQFLLISRESIRIFPSPKNLFRTGNQCWLEFPAITVYAMLPGIRVGLYKTHLSFSVLLINSLVLTPWS